MDYLSIASPNHLHYPQIRMALRLGANALSEKPLVLWPEEIARLKELEARTGRRVYTVLQLRVHPSLLALKERLGQEKGAKDVVLTYVTGRGKWYGKSWKVDEAKSGGLPPTSAFTSLTSSPGSSAGPSMWRSTRGPPR